METPSTKTGIDPSKVRGLGLLHYMFLIMFTLKLGLGETPVMQWSWWLITSPLFVIFFAAILLAILRTAKSFNVAK